MARLDRQMMKIKFDKLIEISSLSKILGNDLLLKIISLILAVVLWGMVGGEDVIEKTIQAPVEVINLPRDLVISNQYKKSIEVSLTGPRSVISALQLQSIVRQIDLAKASPGTMVFANDNDHIEVPSSLKVQRVQPSSIILSLDKLVQKQVPIVGNTMGDVADGYELKSIRMSPDFVVITGPESLLKQVDELQSEYISLDSMDSEQQLQVPLNLRPELVSLIGETTVTADIIVAPKTKIKSVVLSIETGNELLVTYPKTIVVTGEFAEILLRDDEEPEDLLVVKLAEESIGGKVKVIVEPKQSSYDIDVLSVFPSSVELVDENDSRLVKDSEVKEDEETDAEKHEKEVIRLRKDAKKKIKN